MTAAPDPAGAPAPARLRDWPGAVLFDLDGTLVHSGPDIALAVNKSLADLGRASYSVDQVLEWVGEGAARLVQRALTGGGDASVADAELDRALALFHQHYAAGICVNSELYPHVRQVLASLRGSGTRIGCVTNKPERLSRSLLDALGLAPLFDIVVGGDTLESSKPDPEPIRHAARQLGLTPADVVYVGDSLTDCHAAHAAGVPMIAVSYGYNRGVDLTKTPCTAMIDSLAALPETLTSTKRSLADP